MARKRRGVSIRTPRAGRDLIAVTVMPKARVSIRTPRAGRDESLGQFSRIAQRFYPHAPGGARLQHAVYGLLPMGVSIRTPRAGRDFGSGDAHAVERGFYPHAPGGACG